jgi:hypothetical protein
MKLAFGEIARVKRLALLVLIALSTSAPALAAKWFIDNRLGDVPQQQRATATTPQPIQVIIEFHRDAKSVPAAVKEIKPSVIEAMKASGLFSEVSEKPTANGAILNIDYHNVVDKEELARLKKKAFGAGLSFGLASGVVATDNYLINFELIPATGKPSIKTVVEHAIHMKFGKGNEQIPGVQVKNAKEAVFGMVRQSVSKGINNLATDPGFAAFTPVTLPAK